jgi:two-component system LytT family response regulator
MMLKAIIIDDEIAAINALKFLLEKYITDIVVIASANEASEGIAAIEELKPDIVFLDISMPDMNGFAMLDRLGYRDFSLVFTTAHAEYAIQAIRHQASDYLLKPVDIDELKLCVEHIRIKRNRKYAGRHTDHTFSRKFDFTSRIGLPVKEGVIFQSVADIVWIESDGNYCTFHTSDAKKYVVSKNIGEYEEVLPVKEFFRAHKSNLINIKKVKKYIRTDGYFVEMETGAVVEISRRKKDEFLQLMNEVN